LRRCCTGWASHPYFTDLPASALGKAGVHGLIAEAVEGGFSVADISKTTWRDECR